VNVGLEMTHHLENNIIYPNPVTGKSTLTLPDKKEYLLNIYSVSGEKIISLTVSENYDINSNQLSQGMYYYQLVDKKTLKRYNGKFVIVK
jgi:hypothetical protein